ncbi:lysylphosphatidylglycerol synthase transmembrane domain-containing protein [Maribacter sp.]|uniref:lysylphosphatidylglycerol synthase transmembrane domain-containing protein n=1 Tax=Maribacter sp. TaxID=1897614 RepID=UPI0025BA0C43|nr:lysylphosphatidylglycerol synthase transmembrane domain-containing protein [Maribacter sp.]
MNGKLKKNLKTVLPIALGVFLIWYSYNTTSPEDRTQIIKYIKDADLFWVGLSVIIGILSHVSRAIRWNYLLEPLGYKPKLTNNVLIIFLSYFANALIIRSGEVLRPTALATYENVPFEKGLGTIVTERIVDVVMLLIIILTAFLLQTKIIIEILEENGIGLIASISILFIAILGLFASIKIISKSTSKIALKIKTFLKGIQDGVLSIFKMKHKWSFIFHTLFIWFAYVAMFWVIKFTVLETIDLSVSQILVAFIAGAFAMSATNGGLGLFPIAVSKALVVFGISSVSGDAYGWIMWIAQTLMLVVFGTISFLVLPLLNRK